MSTNINNVAPAAAPAMHGELHAGQNRRLVQLERVVVWALLMGGALVMIVPFLWLVSTSLKEQRQIFLFPPQWIPDPVVWRNYPEALTVLPFARFVRNTVLVTVITMVGTLLTSALCAYGFARLRFPGRDLIFMVLLSTLMLPYVVLMIPQYIMFKHLGWIDTYLPLTVPHWFGGGIFNIFLLRQFFRTIPADLTDAGRIDGANELRIFWQIMLPLARPALTVVAIFTFIASWNDFLGPLIYLSSNDKFTIALGLATFKGMYATQWHYLMAASTIMVVPIIVLFFLAQRYFVQGIVMTGLK
ncbi:MAG TPA: carbohydrate ABC transporter permease [Herpetosiphonaceae bacterium]|nr:carbohydrate ABC transporter permease [Herpetosiphonaceae bacterium]